MAKAEVIVWSLCLFKCTLIYMGLRDLLLDFCSWWICLDFCSWWVCLEGGPHVNKWCWLLCLKIWLDIYLKNSLNNQILVLIKGYFFASQIGFIARSYWFMDSVSERIMFLDIIDSNSHCLLTGEVMELQSAWLSHISYHYLCCKLSPLSFP